MKKRGDLARQLLFKKEEELRAMAEAGSSPRLPSKQSSPRVGVRSVAGEAWEQKKRYLARAFVEFMRSSGLGEMQSLGRVMCAILEMGVDEETLVMEGVHRLAAAQQPLSLDSFSQLFSSPRKS